MSGFITNTSSDFFSPGMLQPKVSSPTQLSGLVAWYRADKGVTLAAYIPSTFPAWHNTGGALTDATLVTSQTDPFNGTSAVKLVEGTAVNGFPSINTVTAPNPLTGVGYNYSVIAKAAERHILCLDVYLNNTDDFFASFDLTAGTVLVVSGTISASIASMGNGWWKCTLTGTSVGNFTNVDCVLAIDADVNPYTGDGVSGLYLFQPTLTQNIVATWVDQSGTNDTNKNLLQTTSSKQPTLNISDASYNNQMTLSFVAASSQFLQSSIWSHALTQPATVFLIGQTTQGGTLVMLDGYEATNRIDIYVTPTPDVNFSSNGGATKITINGATTSPSVLAAIYNGASSTGYKTAKTGTTGSVGATGLLGLTLGSAYTGANNINGKIAEVIIYSRILTQTEINNVLTYCSARYAITIGA